MRAVADRVFYAILKGLCFKVYVMEELQEVRRTLTFHVLINVFNDEFPVSSLITAYAKLKVT